VLPAIAPFLRDHPDVRIAIRRDVDRRYVDDLADGRIDFAVTQQASDISGVVDTFVGEEEFVMVKSRTYRTRQDVFLDVSPIDDTAGAFLGAQPKARRRDVGRQRSFKHDGAGILPGVELGLGRAVKASHTLPPGAKVKIDKRYATVRKPVYLVVRQQRYYGRL